MIENATEWLASLAGMASAVVPAQMGATQLAALAAALAFLALGIVIYKEFVQKARLRATLDRVSLLRMPPAARDELIHQSLIDDILSPAPSLRAQELATGSRETRSAVPTGNRNAISTALVERIRKQGHIDYFPPPEILAGYFGDRRFFNNFYTPVIVSNSGRKTAYISSLVLLARCRKSKSLWAFTAFFTLDPLKILDGANQSDLARVGGQFIGASVEPFGSVEMHPWFVPVDNPPPGKLSAGSLPPGDYEMRITGYGSRGKRLFATNWAPYFLTPSLLLDSVLGKDSIGNLKVDDHLADALRDI